MVESYVSRIAVILEATQEEAFAALTYFEKKGEDSNLFIENTNNILNGFKKINTRGK